MMQGTMNLKKKSGKFARSVLKEVVNFRIALKSSSLNKFLGMFKATNNKLDHGADYEKFPAR